MGNIEKLLSEFNICSTELNGAIVNDDSAKIKTLDNNISRLSRNIMEQRCTSDKERLMLAAFILDSLVPVKARDTFEKKLVNKLLGLIDSN